MMNFKDKSIRRNNESKWVRFSAILLAAAMLAGLIFLVFPIKDRMAQKPNFAALAPTTQVIRSQQTQDDNEDLSPAEQMERQDSLFLAATKDIVDARGTEKVSRQKANTTQRKKCHSEATFQKHSAKAKMKSLPSVNKSEVTDDEDFQQSYEVATLAVPSGEKVNMNQQGSHIAISTTVENGSSQHNTMNEKETNKNELDSISATKIESISVLKTSSKSALVYYKDRDDRVLSSK